MQLLGVKLKRLRQDLKFWNRVIFGRLEDNIKRASSSLQDLQNQIAVQGFSDELHSYELQAHEKLDGYLKQHEIFYKEHSRVKWLAVGDRNSSFFHQQFVRKKSNQGIHQLKIGGVLVDDKQAIESHIIDFYQNLFKSYILVAYNIDMIKSVVPHLVNDLENSSLVRCPIMDEIIETIFSMDPHSTPGLDGFTGIFYRLSEI